VVNDAGCLGVEVEFKNRLMTIYNNVLACT